MPHSKRLWAVVMVALRPYERELAEQVAKEERVSLTLLFRRAMWSHFVSVRRKTRRTCEIEGLTRLGKLPSRVPFLGREQHSRDKPDARLDRR